MTAITADQLGLFVVTLSVAILSPGPGVIAITQGAFRMAAGAPCPMAGAWPSAHPSGAWSRWGA